MTSKYDLLRDDLVAEPRSWLVTGVAGFIGSNLLETLLGLGQRVVGLDNFATGHQRNLDEVEASLSADEWQGFHFIEGDIRDFETCSRAMRLPSASGGQVSDGGPVSAVGQGEAARVDYVLHQAALGSVPRSIEDPITTNASNIDGFLNMLVAARDAKVKRFVYAASSSTYGDHPGLPKVEEHIGRPLSPYAVTKYVNELYADVFARSYGLSSIGLRYFNIFGKRQDPNGAYAAVIPKWISAMLRGEDVFINGDGETSRDFCYIDNAVQANILAATATDEAAVNQVYNVAVGDRTSLNELFELLRINLIAHGFRLEDLKARHRDFRPGDVKHSLADISKGARLIGYAPSHRISDGLQEAMAWYVGKDPKIV